jgi:anti-anti-sigma factor
MNASSSSSSSSSPVNRLAIGEDMTIYLAGQQKHQLLGALAATDKLELDLSQVSEMDTAGLQLLILLKKEAQRAGKCVSIVAHSQAVSSLIDFCNMATDFGDPLIIPAGQGRA